MSTDSYFLKIDGIPGESTDPNHPGEIELDSVQWGGMSGGHGAGGGGESSSPQEFSFVAPTSIASPRLSRACATGELLPSAVLSTRRDDVDVLRVTFANVLVASYAVGTSTESGNTVDQVSLSFESEEVETLDQP
jgi:type VI secretion system secreted protein Hcp